MVSNTLKKALSVMLAASVTGAVAADKPVVTVFLYPIEGVQFNAAVVSAGPDANLYTVDCTTTATTSMPPNLCSDQRGLTILQGPKTVSAGLTVATNATTTVEQFICTLDSYLAYCTNTIAIGSKTKTIVSTYTDIAEKGLSPLTITSGASLLTSNVTMLATKGPSGTAKQTSAGTPVMTGGMPRVTQQAAIVGLAGAVVAGAMML